MQKKYVYDQKYTFAKKEDLKQIRKGVQPLDISPRGHMKRASNATPERIDVDD